MCLPLVFLPLDQRPLVFTIVFDTLFLLVALLISKRPVLLISGASFQVLHRTVSARSRMLGFPSIRDSSVFVLRLGFSE
jgi:hypothetical protein